jgi:hypothetical protein
MVLQLKQHNRVLTLPSNGFVEGGTFLIRRLMENATNIGVYTDSKKCSEVN